MRFVWAFVIACCLVAAGTGRPIDDRVDLTAQIQAPASPHLHAVHRAHAQARLAPFVTTSLSAAPDVTRHVSGLEIARRSHGVEDRVSSGRSSRGPPVG
jgi:hypothetical protein